MKKNNILVNLSVWGIESVYRKSIRPIDKKKRNTLCSFYPSCSEYAILSLKKYGFLKGWYKTVLRLKQCNTYRHKKSCVDYP